MIEFNLQFFGGRGSGSGGPSLGGGSGKKINIQSETDIWSYRHKSGNEPFVDAINTGVITVQKDFPDIMDSVNTVSAAKLKGADKQHVLGYYGDGGVALNDNYTDINKMNNVYDVAVKSGHHPGRGNKSGTEAVAIHEMGHAVTDMIAKKIGAKNLDDAAKKIVDNAYKNNKGKGGTKAWAGAISGYAQENNAECIAEAFADFYCNGSKAKSQSKAIVAEMKRMQK